METTPDTPAPRRLYRARDGRYVGGVCAGLGRYFDLSPAIYRIAFVALALAGGTGILVYLAAWAVMPAEGTEESWASEALRRHRDHPLRLIVFALLAFALLLTLSKERFWPSPGNLFLALTLLVLGLAWWRLGERRPRAEAARRPGLLPIGLGAVLLATGVVAVLDVAGVTTVDWRIIVAVLVALTGALVIAGAVGGRRIGGLLVLGLVLVLALALGLAVRVPLFSGIGERSVAPAVLAGLPSTYELGVGRLTVDLSRLELPRGETRLKATVGIGDLLVRVPTDATVEVDGRAQAGRVDLLGRNEHGAHVDQELVDRVGSGRVLVLEAWVGLGRVRVERG
jgi:phage shock protein PspC (stress-responsive transcriptional regulator)